MQRRWRWLGIRAITPEIDELQTQEVQLVDVMGYLALAAADIAQPSSTYIWQGEASWQSAIDRWGFRPQQGDTKPVPPFGPGSNSVLQTPWRITTIPNALSNIRAIPGAAEAIDEVTQGLAA